MKNLVTFGELKPMMGAFRFRKQIWAKVTLRMDGTNARTLTGCDQRKFFRDDQLVRPIRSDGKKGK